MPKNIPAVRKRKINNDAAVDSLAAMMSGSANVDTKKQKTKDERDAVKYFGTDSANDLYIVEELVNMRYSARSRQFEFLVKFEGYAKKNWLPYSDIGPFWHETMDSMIVTRGIMNCENIDVYNYYDKESDTFIGNELQFTDAHNLKVSLSVRVNANHRVYYNKTFPLAELITATKNRCELTLRLKDIILKTGVYRNFITNNNSTTPIVWSYGRLSSRSQANDKALSFHVQRNNITRYLTEKGNAALVVHFEEIASARINTTSKQVLLHTIIDNFVMPGDSFIVSSVDRFSRDREFGAKMIRTLSEKHAKFIAAQQQLTNENHYHVKTIFDLINTAHNESDDISQRVRSAQSLIANYGFKIITDETGTKQKVPDATEQKIITQIKMMLTGYKNNARIAEPVSAEAVAGFFNNKQIYRRGVPWTEGSVRRLGSLGAVPAPKTPQRKGRATRG